LYCNRALASLTSDCQSYVGGLYKDQGLEVVRAWLSELLLPHIRSAYATVRAEHGLPPSPTPPLSPVIENEVTDAVHALESPSFGPAPDTGGSHDAVAFTPSLELNTMNSLPIGPLPPPSHTITTTIGHLALFNQRLQHNSVEWIYENSEPSAPSTSSPSTSVTLPVTQPHATRIARNSRRSTPMWTVRVLVDGEYFGKGRGGTKKVARNEAAKEGLAKLGINVE
jgi:ribonuclease-3